ncbi:two-component sensor histidine kinase [Streptomyces mobaraensis NBRC 13819 = DSM 40847]|uniref:histidine kinase n=2 Tax=Streptomyces mobaraensis TaxID=35621 RepID=A0A5N5W6P9_STRMB|nr:histidine kinase [Streptomyces mobaraensis]EME99317.1 putative two-component system sensor kinase [Streptomyces mobaraensis NBRC 13819 = DSM 40847]KAB7842597.1 two-component sensor histidine kinase [Streptomyces mobaraensis]QTT73472.1 two-component sensor histidine kinase [Streptomyces mobaraensis NBRC 13819 = DSM 40847]
MTTPAVRGPLRAHPTAADAVVAAIVLALMIGTVFVGHRVAAHPLSPLFVACAVLAAAALAVRRRAPRTVLVVTSVLTAVGAADAADGVPRIQVALSAVVALYTVVSRTERAAALRIAAVTITALTGAVMLLGPPPWYSQENVGMLAWAGMAAAAGDAVRSRRAYIAAIEERALRAERSREEEARRRVAEERLRIARELHDVVAHHIALVNVQAGVASHVMDSRPDQAKQALAHVREASRSALDELRSTVGLLRQYGDSEAPTEPAPGMGAFDQLVDGFTRAGLRVAVTVTGAPADAPAAGDEDPAASVAGALPAAVDLTAYRVLQEALTNVHKHAGPGARAEVVILRAPGSLVLTVLDDGPEDGVPGDGGTAGGGHGLVGMRERVTALGGTIETGPRQGTAGFRVRVRLPVPSCARRLR